MQTTTVIHNEKEFKIENSGDFSTVDYINVLTYVGLSNLATEKEIQKIMCSNWERTKVIRYIAYMQDISFKKARKKYLKFILVYMGIHLTWAISDLDRVDCMKVGKGYIEWILNLDYISTNKVVEMINKEGFSVKYDEINTPQKYNSFHRRGHDKL